MILAGGPGLDCDYLLPVAQHLAGSNRAILVELRGTGRSRPKVINHDTVNFALYLEDLEALLAQLGFERWTVAGHSAGGLLAMQYAAAHPEHIDKLVLLDTAPVASEFGDAFTDNILMRLPPSAQRNSSLHARLPGYFFDQAVGKKFANEVESHHYLRIDTIQALGAGPGSQGYDLRLALKDFDRPVLVLSGVRIRSTRARNTKPIWHSGIRAFGS